MLFVIIQYLLYSPVTGLVLLHHRPAPLCQLPQHQAFFPRPRTTHATDTVTDATDTTARTDTTGVGETCDTDVYVHTSPQCVGAARVSVCPQVTGHVILCDVSVQAAPGVARVELGGGQLLPLLLTPYPGNRHGGVLGNHGDWRVRGGRGGGINCH